MKKIYLTFLFPFYLISNYCWGQYSHKFQNPMTPEVYQMEKYGNPEISLYTGRPNVNIPLHHIDHGDIKIPLNISYSSNGIRADEEASRIGLGWYMEQPMITQIVNGYDDLKILIKRPKFYYNYKASYLVDPQPLWWYQYRFINPQISVGNVPQRLNISYNLISNPNNHLNDYFIGKLKSDGGLGGYSGTFVPLNGSLESLNFNKQIALSPLYGKDFDVELDFFKMSFYGHNITFYKKPNEDQFYVLNKKGYKIILNRIGDFNFSWTITTPDGKQYFFEKQESSARDGASTDYFQGLHAYIDNKIPVKTPNYALGGLIPTNEGSSLEISGRSWKLTKILDINHNQVIFSYKDLDTIISTFSSMNGKCKFLNIFNNFSNYNYSAAQYEKLEDIGTLWDATLANGNYKYCDFIYDSSNQQNSILNKITYGNSSIDFYSSSRQDKIYDEKYDSIIVKNNNARVKNIKFNTENYPSNHVLSKRMNLNSIQINNQKYTFDYYKQNIPTEYSDYWGYFNGLPNKTPYINPFRLYKNISDIPVWALPIYEEIKDSENKSAHPEFIKVGILDKITYPTGGYTKFDYELNTFDNYFIPNLDNKITLIKNNFNINHLNTDFDFTNRTTPSFEAKAGDVINGKISLTNGISGTCQYSNSSFKIVKIPADWISQYNSGISGRNNFWYVVDNGYISVETVYHKTGFTSLSDFNFSLNIAADATLAARVKYDPSCPTSGSPIGSIRAVFGSQKYNDYPQNYSSGFGLRVKQTTDYNESGAALTTKYSYSGGKHISPINPVVDDKRYMMNHLYHDSTYPNLVNRNVSEGNQIISNNTTTFQTNVLGNGDFVGYDLVKVEKISGNNTIGKTLHHFSNIPDYMPSEKFGITDDITRYEMNLFGRGIRKADIDNGSLLRQEFIDSNNDTIKKIKYNYVTSVFNDVTNSDCYNISFKYITTDGNFTSTTGIKYYQRYNFYFYPLKAMVTLLKNQEETDFLQNKQLITRSSFSYDSYNLLTLKSTLYPSLDEVSEGTGYSHQIPRFLQANILTGNIGRSVIKNGKQILNQATKYDNINHYNPTSTVSYELNSPNINVPPDVIYDQYDNKGNLLQYTTKDGISTAIIWGYNNTQPIAKVIGATYAQVSLLSTSIVSASDLDALNPTNEPSLVSALDNFRKNASLSGMQITTYTYDPLIGVTSINPPNGIREIYLYDSANRLKEIRQMETDSSGNITYKTVKEFKYNYKP